MAWRWIYLFVALALLSVAYVLFGMKCYHLHEGVFGFFEEVVVVWRKEDCDYETV